jgi:ComF family protein
MTSRGQLCGHCQQRPPNFDQVHAPFIYDFPIAQMISALKFNGRHGLAPLLGELLADELEGRIATPDVILPVPLHRRRLRERGYNQALELARPIARRRQCPLDTRSLMRDQATEALSHLDRKQRRRVIRNAFQLAPDFSARHVALVDDVVTTGSTVGEIAGLLVKAGVERVDVWALARTPQARAVKRLR